MTDKKPKHLDERLAELSPERRANVEQHKQRMLKDAAALNEAADLVSSRGNRLTLEETCNRLGISVDQVRTRAAQLRDDGDPDDQ